MEKYNRIKNEIVQINQDILSLLDQAKSITGVSENAFLDWEKACNTIDHQIKLDILRVAVVGTIKSGKSTFTNSVFNQDYLKRGAGVVTSIVTKIRKSPQLKAVLYFKSWEHVNSDMNQALVLFPSFNSKYDNHDFDIREKKDRDRLQQALDRFSSELMNSDGTRDPNSVLLSTYLKGFDKVKDIISSDNFTAEYKNNQFEAHKKFVGDDSLSVYLKDIKLEINSGNIADNIEIADCQGSDSPNPLHLSMIQEYLLKTHLIVYVISSRTGIRQADIKFLSMINRMGIMDNILFVINCDFTEHESLQELNALTDKVSEDICIIKKAPQIFTFSTLYNLLKHNSNQIPAKEIQRLYQWEAEKDFTDFSDKETARFFTELEKKLTKERASLFLKNHLGRMEIISHGIKRWINLNYEILSKDKDNRTETIHKIRDNQQQINQVKSMIKSAIDGAKLKIRKELKEDIESFFNNRVGGIIENTSEFIKNYTVSYNQYDNLVKTSNFTHALYLAFHQFRQDIERYITEIVNPEIMRFIINSDQKVLIHFKETGVPFLDTIQERLSEYETQPTDLKNHNSQESLINIELPNIDTIKTTAKLAIPPITASINYSAKVKTEAIMHLWFYSSVKLVKKIFKKGSETEQQEKISALKQGIKRIKQETGKSILFHFKSYKENTKFQYAFKLVDAVSETLYSVLLDRFQSYTTDFSSIADTIYKEKADKEKALKVLKEMEAGCGKINETIEELTKQNEQV